MDILTLHQDDLSLPALYPRLLGPAWDTLAEVVRRHHLEGSILQAAGSFRIRHGAGRGARLLAWLLRLPPEAQAAKTRLVIRAQGDGEQWRRTFADRLLVTRQNSAGAQLAEHFRGLEIRFRLAVVDGAMHYYQTRAALTFGPLRIPLPSWLAPRIAAWERPADLPDRVHVTVEVGLPMLGRLIAYDGTIAREEPRP